MRSPIVQQAVLFIIWTVSNTLYITQTTSFLSTSGENSASVLVQLLMLVQSTFGCVLTFFSIKLLDRNNKQPPFRLGESITTKKDALYLFIYTICHFVGAISYVRSFYGSGKQVILAQFVKASEPLTTALLNYALFGAAISPTTFLAIFLVVSGLLTASSSPGDLAANGAALAAMASNIACCMRNVVSKKLMERENCKNSDGHLFLFASFFSLVLVGLPMSTHSALPLDFINSNGVLSAIFQIGLLSAIYQRCSIGFLKSVSVVDHAIANGSRRLLVLVIITFTLSGGFSLSLYLGLTLVIFGVVVRASEKGRRLSCRQLAGMMAALIVTAVISSSRGKAATTSTTTAQKIYIEEPYQSNQTAVANKAFDYNHLVESILNHFFQPFL